MENVNRNEKAIVRVIEGVLFTMLGIFCLAFPQPESAVTLGSVAVSAKDLLGLAYIITGFVFGHWPAVQFVRPRSMNYKANNKVAAA